jgi:hypothetical protein
MTIEEWQKDLKRITFRVVWDEGVNIETPCVPGAKFEFCQTTYLHHYSDYGHGE